MVHAPFYCGGQWKRSAQGIPVVYPYTGKTIATVSKASPADAKKAVSAAHIAFQATRLLPSHARHNILMHLADGIRAKHKEFTTTIVQEMGKVWNNAATEVDRAISTCVVAAEEAKRIPGEVMSLDWVPGADNRWGIIRRFPLGVIFGITPFNFPLNLVLHKIAPAIASGNTIVLKPASTTPLSALKLAELIDATELPKGAVSVLPMSSQDTPVILNDERVKMVSFTGSPAVGWKLKAQAGMKKVALELGGNAGVIVADDADVDLAVQRIAIGAFGVAGQSCISVQRVYVQRKVLPAFLQQFAKEARAIEIGDPMDPKTALASMANEDAAKRTEAWILEAVQRGAKVVTGGKRKGAMVAPTILTNVPKTAKVCTEEAFAPLVVVFFYEKFSDAIMALNDSVYGLQAGVFTNRLKDIMFAYQELEVGGVMVNEVPTWRADQMPYGGVKASGFGREGLKYAIEEMTEPRMLAFNMNYKT